MMTQTLSLLFILFLTVEWKECTTTGVQGMLLDILNISATSDKTPDKRCVSSTDVTTNTPYIQIVQGRDGRDGMPGYPGIAGPPGKDGTNGKDGEKGDKGEQGPQGRLYLNVSIHKKFNLYFIS